MAEGFLGFIFPFEEVEIVDDDEVEAFKVVFEGGYFLFSYAPYEGGGKVLCSDVGDAFVGVSFFNFMCDGLCDVGFP